MAKEAIATETIHMDYEKAEPTWWADFCQRRGINPNLIMLKITLFVMYGGEFVVDLYN